MASRFEMGMMVAGSAMALSGAPAEAAQNYNIQLPPSGDYGETTFENNCAISAAVGNGENMMSVTVEQPNVRSRGIKVTYDLMPADASQLVDGCEGYTRQNTVIRLGGKIASKKDVILKDTPDNTSEGYEVTENARLAKCAKGTSKAIFETVTSVVAAPNGDTYTVNWGPVSPYGKRQMTQKCTGK